MTSDIPLTLNAPAFWERTTEVESYVPTESVERRAGLEWMVMARPRVSSNVGDAAMP